MQLKIVMRKGKDGYFVAQCPALKSCWSQGTTEEEALRNIKEAIELYLESDDVVPENAKVYELAL